MSPGPKVLRLFVAITLPAEVKSALNDVQRELCGVLPPNTASWTRPDNLHLTLRFLGSVDQGRLPELERRLRENLASFGPLELVCERLGCFPDLHSPRVVWTWVHDEAERLALLHRRVDEAVGGFAERPAEERFVGHVTIARPRRIKRAEAEQLARFVARAAERRFGVWRCSGLELIESDLSPDGSRYTTLAIIPL